MRARFLSVRIVQGLVFHVAAEYGARAAELAPSIRFFLANMSTKSAGLSSGAGRSATPSGPRQ